MARLEGAPRGRAVWIALGLTALLSLVGVATGQNPPPAAAAVALLLASSAYALGRAA